MSSSDSPSEKYSWSFFSLMSRNGRTATDFSGIGEGAVATEAEGVFASTFGTGLGHNHSPRLAIAVTSATTAATESIAKTRGARTVGGRATLCAGLPTWTTTG